MTHTRTITPRSTLAAAAGIGLVLLSGSKVIAQSIDMTTLRPGYINDLGEFIPGISPYYSQVSTPTSLQIVGVPNLPNSLGTHNQTAFPFVTGDFSAVITGTVGPHSGGFIDADFTSGYAGGALNNNQVWANYGLGFGNVNTGFMNYSSGNVVFDLTRSGSTFNVYASFGGAYINLVTLVGSSVSGGVGFDVGGWGDPDIAAPSSTTLSNFYVSSVSTGSITGLTGGTPSDPLMLPATTTKSISGDIGGPSDPTSDFYSFYWKGGNFLASVGVPDASGLLSPPSYEFELCDGTSCVSPLEQTIADSSNSWESSLSGDLTAGFYTVGIIDLTPSLDPHFVIAFDTPINQIASIPEPSTWATILLGFAGLGFAGYRTSRRAVSIVD